MTFPDGGQVTLTGLVEAAFSDLPPMILLPEEQVMEVGDLVINAGDIDDLAEQLEELETAAGGDPVPGSNYDGGEYGAGSLGEFAQIGDVLDPSTFIGDIPGLPDPEVNDVAFVIQDIAAVPGFSVAVDPHTVEDNSVAIINGVNTNDNGPLQDNDDLLRLTITRTEEDGGEDTIFGGEGDDSPQLQAIEKPSETETLEGLYFWIGNVENAVGTYDGETDSWVFSDAELEQISAETPLMVLPPEDSNVDFSLHLSMVAIDGSGTAVPPVSEPIEADLLIVVHSEADLPGLVLDQEYIRDAEGEGGSWQPVLDGEGNPVGSAWGVGDYGTDQDLHGGEGDDQIYAGNGDDTVSGHGGNDVLWGDTYRGDAVIKLDINPQLNDNDGSEFLVLQINGVPEGSTLVKYNGEIGEYTELSIGESDVFTNATNEGGNWEFTLRIDQIQEFIDNIHIVTPHDTPDFELEIKVRSVDIDSDIEEGGVGDGDVNPDGVTEDELHDNPGYRDESAWVVGTITVDVQNHGEHGDDLIAGGRGNDEIHGQGGNDTVYGGQGNDVAYGDEGNDYIVGDGTDSLRGIHEHEKPYDNTQIVNDGEGSRSRPGFDDDLFGGDGNDTIIGDNDGSQQDGEGEGQEDFNLHNTGWNGAGDDYIEGGDGRDTIVGDNRESDYYASADAGDDTIFGGNGKDHIVGDNQLNGRSVFSEDSGDDQIHGGRGNDTIIGDNEASGRYGAVGAGDDTISGGRGNDTIVGDNVLDGEGRIGARAGNDDISGGRGNDVIYGDNVETYYDGEGNGYDARDDGGFGPRNSGGHDTIDGGRGHDTVYGQQGNDQIDGGRGNDDLYGGTGGDTISGGRGNDYIQGDDTNFNGPVFPEPFPQGFGDENPGRFPPRPPFDNSDDDLSGGRGNDTIYGMRGDDQIDGGKDNDYMDGGSGIDTVYGNDGDDTGVFVVGENADGGFPFPPFAPTFHGGDGEGYMPVPPRGPSERYDGGKGEDTLVLRYNPSDLENAEYVTEIRMIEQFIADNSDSGTDSGAEFNAAFMRLTVQDWEDTRLIGPELPVYTHTVSIENEEILEDNTVELDISLDLGGDSLYYTEVNSFTISGLPEGATLNVGVESPAGTWTFRC